MWLILLFSTTVSIVTLGLYKGAGLSTSERILFNSIVNNYTAEWQMTQSLWDSLEPLESVIQNQTASVAHLKMNDVAECTQSVESFMGTLLTEAALVDAAISAVDLAPLASLQPLLTLAQSMVSALPQKVGLTTLHRAGTMQWANVANETYEFVNGTYQLESVNFDGSVELYYVRIPNLGYHLTIQTLTTAIVMKEWDPPLFVPSSQTGAASEALLDRQRNKIAILPGTSRFTRRQYDLANGRIVWYGNITAGQIVVMSEDLEINLFAY